MGASSNRAARARPLAPLQIQSIPYSLSKEEDHERIKELARKILAVVESRRKTKKKLSGSRSQLVSDLFESKTEEQLLGIK